MRPVKSIHFKPAGHEDGQVLADLRVVAMQESLRALDRFDPVRARDRFLSGFDPSCTQLIFQEDRLVGFWVLRAEDTAWLLDHLYVDPGHQSKGIGAQVLAHVSELADHARKILRLGALKGSRSNHFYLRHGFVKVDEGEWDNYYARYPASGPD